MKRVYFFVSLVALAIFAISIASASSLIIRPNGNGYYSGWSNIGCIYGYECVDEASANTTDYLSSANSNAKETFSFQNTGLSNVTINNLTLFYYAQRYNSQKYNTRPLIRISSTDYFGSVMTTASSYALYSQTFTSNPSTGSAWTVSDIENLEAGMNTYPIKPGAKIAQVYAVVDYSTPDSCSDSDNGGYPFIFGTASGYYNNNPFSDNDYCIDSGSVMEYSCTDGTVEDSTQTSCGSDGYGDAYCIGDNLFRDYTDYFCAGGACGYSVDAVFQSNCSANNGYGERYCNGSEVYSDYYYNYCWSGSCYGYSIPESVENCEYGCTNGVCNPVPDSCSDSDGGYAPLAFGTATGYFLQVPYSNSDYCLSNSTLIENFCSGVYKNSTAINCWGNRTCISGKCV
jgi:hypothetical protein